MSQRTASSAKLALAARELREKQDVELLRSEPIAVIGVGCRVPRGDGPDGYWNMLATGTDAIGEIPADRWDVDAYYSPDPAAPGKMTIRWGGFLDSVDAFDAGFYGLAPREVAAMDPQQRLLLEVVWEALEDAGQVVESLAGAPVGVFVAVYNSDYAHALLTDLQGIDAYTSSGTAHSIAAGRISFLFDFRGPSVAVDSACSASLVAVHLACQSLRLGESDLALAGGASLILAPEPAISMSKWGMLAPDGRCKTFDARANGFVRGEGGAVVVLKRLSDAIAAGDPIRGIIRGSAVNQDGRSANLTAPNGLAQQAVVRQALENARVDPAQISYVEAHGTGTTLGDPIEVEALAEALGNQGPGAGPCALASVKTNIGHLEAAAGVAGLIKVVLSLQRKQIPPHLHFRGLNSHISFEGTRFYVPTELREWNVTAGPRLAGVSSFGFGGTNAHVVLEEAFPLPPLAEESPRAHILPVSARSAAALRAAIERLAEAVSRPGQSLRDVAFTAAVRRSHHPHRAAVVGDTLDAVRGRLQALASDGLRRADADDHGGSAAPRVAFVFSGQGPQWCGMARLLLEQDEAFRESFHGVDGILRGYSGWSVEHELARPEPESRLSRTEIVQPVLFALQVALTELWRSWGIAPAAVVGHSLGEIAAAWVSGALSLEDAARIAVLRGRLMQQATGLGKMAAVEAPARDVAGLIADMADRLAVGAVNAPSATVVSGEPKALDSLLERLSERGVAWKRLPVDYAFHSPQMEPFREELAAALGDLRPGATSCPMVSTLTGDVIDGRELNGRYWSRNLRETVEFARAVGRLLDDGLGTFIEVSPHPVLAGYVSECAHDRGIEAVTLPSLRRGTDERTVLLGSLGRLYELGADVEWGGVHPRGGRCVDLPRYPWQRKRFWTSSARRSGSGDWHETGHVLLGRRLDSAMPETQFEARLDVTSLPYVSDHQILGSALLPATAILDAALKAAAHALGPRPHAIEDVSFESPLLLADPGAVAAQIILRPGEAGAGFEFHSREEGAARWVRHARGRVAQEAEDDPPPRADVEGLRPEGAQTADGQALYAEWRARGLGFGPRFQGIDRVWFGEDEALVRLVRPPSLEDQPGRGIMEPPLLDACLQGLACLCGRAPGGGVYVPSGVDRFRVFGPPRQPGWSHITVRKREGGHAIVADVRAYDREGGLAAEWTGLCVRPVARGALQRDSSTNWLYRLAWRTAEAPDPVTHPGAPGTWLLLEDESGVGAALAESLVEGGHKVLRVRRGARRSDDESGPLFVDPSKLDDFRHALENASTVGSSLSHVVHLWGLDETLSEDDDPGALEDRERRLCQGALHLVRSLGQLTGTPPRLVFVTRGAQSVEAGESAAPLQAELWGLRATIALEHPHLNCGAIDLDPRGGEGEVRLLQADVCSDGSEPLVALRAGSRNVGRLEHSKAGRGRTRPGAPLPRPVRLEVGARGLLDSLAWEPAERTSPGPGEVEVRVHATGLNFRDVLNALDRYPGDPGPLGDECSGIVEATGPGVTRLQPGDEVTAFVPGAFASYVTAPASLVAAKPENMELSAAAALPIAMLTAEHALLDIAELREGQTVLIHAAAGGVGQAAVEVARRRGASVFATAGSPAKREHLLASGALQAWDSRSLEFAEQVLEVTGGRGVDVVLNSLGGEFISRSLAVVRRGGHFLEIGRTGIWSEDQVAALGREIRYHVVFLGDLRDQEPERVGRMLRGIVQRVSDGRLTPPPVRVFPRCEVEGAFRFMAQARHIGKIVVAQGTDGREGSSASVREDVSYLITGGLGGLGLQVARTLVGEGARHLVLAGRSTPSEDALRVLDDLREAGARVEVVSADVSRYEDALRLVSGGGSERPPLRGIIHAAGVRDDGLLAELDMERFSRVQAAKTRGAWNLHLLTREREMDFFVCFSSAASWLGWAGQGPYAAANAFLDALARHRRSLGLPGVSIAWGPWHDLGMTSGLAERDWRRLQEHGLHGIPRDRGVALALELIGSGVPNVAVLNADWTAYASSFPHGRAPRLVEGLSRVEGPAAGEGGAASPVGLIDTLEATPLSRRRAVVQKHVEALAGRILGLDPTDDVDPRRPLRELGLDSLMAVEIRNALAAMIQAPLPATLLFEHPTLDDLVSRMLAEVSGPPPEKEGDETLEGAGSIANLSEDEAERELLAELDAHGTRPPGD